jgi:hypothetical protein
VRIAIPAATRPAASSARTTTTKSNPTRSCYVPFYGRPGGRPGGRPAESGSSTEDSRATFAVIAADLGLSRAGARKLVVKGLEAKRAGNEKLTAVLRATDNARLETAVKGLMPKVEQGDPKSVMALVAVLARRARLMGLDLDPSDFKVAASAGVSRLDRMSESELVEYARRLDLLPAQEVK